MCYLQTCFKQRETIYIDFETGKSRKIFSSIDMSKELKSALLGFHAFTDNYYVSSIFGKSERFIGKMLQKAVNTQEC